MKKLIPLFLTLIVLTIVLSSCAPVGVDPSDPNAIMLAVIAALQYAVTILAGLSGLATLVTWFVNILKSKGIIKDGQAPAAIAVCNGVLVLLIASLVLWVPTFDFKEFDGLLGVLFGGGLNPVISIPFLMALLQFIEKFIHTNVMTDVPFIGFSYSRKALLERKMPVAVVAKSEKVAKGQGLVEYALIIALVAIVVIAALTLLGPLIAKVFESINAAIGGA